MKTLRQHLLNEKTSTEYIPKDSNFESLLEKIKNKIKFKNILLYLRYSLLFAIVLLFIFQIPSIIKPKNSLVTAAENIQKVVEGIFNDKQSILHHKQIETIYDQDGNVKTKVEYELYKDNSAYERFNNRVVTTNNSNEITELSHQINNGELKYEYSSTDKTLTKTKYMFQNPEDKEVAIQSIQLVGLPQLMESIKNGAYPSNYIYEIQDGDGTITIIEFKKDIDSSESKTEYLFNSATYLPIKLTTYQKIDNQYVLYQTVETVALEVLPRDEESLSNLFDVKQIDFDIDVTEIIEKEFVVKPLQ